AHRVAEAGCDVDVAGDQLSGGASKAVGHGDDEALLHRHHIGEIGMVLQRVHDRQFGGAGIAEQMRDALVLQQCQECGAAGDLVFHVSSCPPLRRAGWKQMTKLERRMQWSKRYSCYSYPGRGATRSGAPQSRDPHCRTESSTIGGTA